MNCFDDEYSALWRQYAEQFPDSDWGYEGCGLSDDDVIKTLQRSLDYGIDYLTASFPAYPKDVIIA